MRLYLFVALIAFIILGACKKNKSKIECDGSNPSYNSAISSIISSSCLNSSCHGSGSSNPNFTSYANLQPYLANGKFKKKVLDERSMPKNGSLTDEQLTKIQCWADNNYPEN
jgi:hypothetical protein